MPAPELTANDALPPPTQGLPIPKELPRGEQWRLRELKRLRLIKHDGPQPKWSKRKSHRVRRCDLRVPPPYIPKRFERHYGRKQKEQVVHWMMYAYMPKESKYPYYRQGYERDGLPRMHQRNYDTNKFRSVTIRETHERFGVPSQTLINWWRNRKKYLPASDFDFEKTYNDPPPTEQQREAMLASNPQPPPPDAGAPASLDELAEDRTAGGSDDAEGEDDDEDSDAFSDDEEMRDDSLERELEEQLCAELGPQTGSGRTGQDENNNDDNEDEDPDDDS